MELPCKHSWSKDVIIFVKSIQNFVVKYNKVLLEKAVELCLTFEIQIYACIYVCKYVVFVCVLHCFKITKIYIFIDTHTYSDFLL